MLPRIDLSPLVTNCQNAFSFVANEVQKGLNTCTETYSRVSAQVEETAKNVQAGFHDFVSARALSLAPLPTQERVEELHKTAVEKLKKLTPEREGKVVTLQRENDVLLSGVEITTNPKTAPHLQKWIVFFCPNAFSWEQIGYKIRALATSFEPQENINILCFNYRGVGKSTGFPHSEKEVLQDGKAIIQLLLDRGVPAKQILLHGYSFGGGVATCVAGDFAKEGEGCHFALCNERSFLSIPAVLENRLPPFIGTLFGNIALENGWKVSSEEAARYITAKVLVMSHPQDELITPQAQFRNCMKNKGNCEEIVMTEDPNSSLPTRLYNRFWSHGRTWYPEENARYINFVRGVLDVE